MKTDFLKKRAQTFYKVAKRLLEEGDLAIAAFNFEQAAQLYLKYFLFLKLKDFPKIHSLTKLLREVGKAYRKELQAKKITKENIGIISDLEQAYLTSRYLPAEFYLSQVKDMNRFLEILIDFLGKL